MNDLNSDSVVSCLNEASLKQVAPKFSEESHKPGICYPLLATLVHYAGC